MSNKLGRPRWNEQRGRPTIYNNGEQMIATTSELSPLLEVRVSRVNPQTDPRWDAYVAAHPEGLVFHHSAWLRVIEEAYGFGPVHLLCESRDGSIRGILPLFRVRAPITGYGLYCLPRTPTAGPLVLDGQAVSALIEAALGLVDRPRERLDVRLTATWLDGLVGGVTGRPVATTYRMGLPEPGAQVRFGNSANHGSVRRAVDKAAREGVEVRPAETEEDLRSWYWLYLEAMRSHATPPRPYRFFRACWSLLRPVGLMNLLVAEKRTKGRVEMLAGSAFFMFGKTVFYLYNGRRGNALALRPNDAIFWEAIHQAHAGGYSYFDFGEVPEENAGLARFKSKWGARPEHRYLYRYPHSNHAGSDSHGSFRRTRQAMKGLWSLVPLGVTALVGDFVYSKL